MDEPKVASKIVLDGGSVQIDGVEFPWMVTPEVAVETVLDNPQPGEAQLHTVTLTLYADSVEVRNLPPRATVTYSRALSQYSENITTESAS